MVTGYLEGLEAMEIGNCGLHTLGIIAEQSHARVAMEAEQSSNSPRFVAMVNVEPLALSRRLSTDRTKPILIVGHSVEIARSKTIQILQSVCGSSVKSLGALFGALFVSLALLCPSMFLNARTFEVVAGILSVLFLVALARLGNFHSTPGLLS